MMSGDVSYRELADSLPQTVFEADTDGRLKFLNQSAFEAFGIHPEEVERGLSMSQLVVFEERRKLSLHVKEVFERRTSREGEFKGQSRKGRIFPVALHSKPVISDGKISGLRGMIIDISDRQRREKQWLRDMKLESIGILAGGIAHEFNNRLMSIQGNVSLMLLDIDSSSEHYDRLKKIENTIREGADFTRQLIRFAGGGKYRGESVNINRVVRKTSRMFVRTRRQIHVRLHLDQGLWAVEADPSQIELALMSLYVNAWQAMTGAGELAIETTNEILTDEALKAYDAPGGKYVRVTVQDNGTGIDREILEKIFDPFVSALGIGKSTGMGLSAVYGIVRKHKGFIEVTGGKKRGARFDIFLPACEPSAPDHFSAAAQPGKTILLVDDDEMIIDVTGQMLKREGFEVISAGSGLQAVDMFKRHEDQIALVVLDMIMPGMGGKKTFKNLKSLKPEIKVLLSSGYSMDYDVREVMASGACGFIQKPYSIRELVHKVDEILNL